MTSVEAFQQIVMKAEAEGRRLTVKERLQNPALQKDLAAEKAQTIKSAEKAVEKAKAALKAAEHNLAVAKKENG